MKSFRETVTELKDSMQKMLQSHQVTGQKGYTSGGLQDWVVGKSPTPMGGHWLSTKREKLYFAEPYGTPFYLLSSEQGERWINGPGNVRRTDCGLHLDNRLPGTAGCTALECETPSKRQKAEALFAKLDELHAQGIHFIQYVVL